MKHFSIFVALGLAAVSVAAQAGEQAVLKTSERHQQDRRLIQLSENDPGTWLTEYEILTLVQQRTPFMDITDHPPTLGVEQLIVADKVPAETSYHEEVQRFIDDLDTTNMQENLETFTSFHNRYYKSSWGARSCAWLLERIKQIAEPANDRVTVEPFHHKWDQFSIIARFNGTNPDLDNEVVIVSAHQDSVNMWLPDFGRAPGADDDGSGTVTILEAFRSLVDNGFEPERPVEFHWYSAEEGGLLGSQDVAKAYNKAHKDIVAMVQNDMTGYIGANGEVFGIATDYVHLKVTNFIKKLVDTYADIPYVETECGYACSDHASWRKYGYPSSFVMESAFDDSNHYIHTWDDTIDKLSFDHMKEFAKVDIGFAVELSHQRE
ncbi:hypothetical protein O0I10_009455 [Lichtheimia ornata]|uniref:Peptide hydrolase n=1 Tax=Lichtheimia ornata TaxID=688661 RepID=A0AAD7XUF6_9FUNG|nr:uncharacterized protein O0I10_009455 [Lichtheimia ornata]KAJ8654890.1 hypothetical protein O0I10_009455 [Lichtheimia ornata]